MDTVNITFESGAPAHTMAVMSAAQSVAWIESLMTFMDEFMKSLTASKFLTKKGLHMTTRLVKHIFVEWRYFKRGNCDGAFVFFVVFEHCFKVGCSGFQKFGDCCFRTCEISSHLIQAMIQLIC